MSTCLIFSVCLCIIGIFLSNTVCLSFSDYVFFKPTFFLVLTFPIGVCLCLMLSVCLCLMMCVCSNNPFIMDVPGGVFYIFISVFLSLQQLGGRFEVRRGGGIIHRYWNSKLKNITKGLPLSTLDTPLPSQWTDHHDTWCYDLVECRKLVYLFTFL